MIVKNTQKNHLQPSRSEGDKGGFFCALFYLAGSGPDCLHGKQRYYVYHSQPQPLARLPRGYYVMAMFKFSLYCLELTPPRIFLG